MATGGEDVDSRVTCSVCLEPYNDRLPKTLPCFHTFCLSCLSELAERGKGQTTVGDVSGGDAENDEGKSPDSLTCPKCQTTVYIPPGGVKDFQTNFSVDGSSHQENSQPLPCNLCDRQQDAQFRCGECQNDFCFQCRSCHDTSCPGRQIIEIPKTPTQTPTIDRGVDSTAGSLAETQHYSQLKAVEDALRKIEANERKLDKERKNLEEGIHVRYATLLLHAGDARDACMTSLREAYDRLTEQQRFHMARTERVKDLIQHQLSSSQPTDTMQAGDNSALERELQGVLSMTSTDQESLLQHVMKNNIPLLVECVQSFMGKIEPRAVNKACGSHDSDPQTGEGTPQPVAWSGPIFSLHSEDLRRVCEKLEELTDQVTVLHSVNAQLIKSNTKLTTEQSALRKELSTLKDSNTMLMSEQEDVHRKVTTLSDTNVVLQQDVAALTFEKDQLSMDLGKLQQEFVSVQTDNTSLQADITQLNTNVDTTKSELITMQQTIQQDVDVLKSEKGKLCMDLGKLQQEFVSVQTDNTSLQADITQLNANVDATRSELITMQQNIQTVQGDNAEMKNDIAKLEADCDITKSELNNTQSDIQSVHRHNAVMKKDISRLTANLETVQSNISAVQMDIQALQETNTKIQNDISQPKPVHRSLKSDVSWAQIAATAPQSGVFTVPTSGTYCFLATTSPFKDDSGKKARLAIESETKVEGYVHSMGYSRSTGHTAVHLSAGQKVWLKTYEDEEYTFCDRSTDTARMMLLNGQVDKVIKMAEQGMDSALKAQCYLLKAQLKESEAKKTASRSDSRQNSEEEIDGEEKELIQQQLQEAKQQEKQNRAGNVLLKFFRSLIFKKRLERLRIHCSQRIEYELFLPFILTETMCGVCGVSYKKSPETNEPAAGTADGEENAGEEETEEGETAILTELRQAHLISKNHRRMYARYRSFREAFRSVFGLCLIEMGAFLSRHQVKKQKNGWYKNMHFQIDTILKKFETFQHEVNQAILERKWGERAALIQQRHELINFFNEQVRQPVKRQFEMQQEQRIQKVAAKEAERQHQEKMEDGFVEDPDMIEIYNVVDMLQHPAGPNAQGLRGGEGGRRHRGKGRHHVFSGARGGHHGGQAPRHLEQFAQGDLPPRFHNRPKN